jgi:hypothetical protein
MNQLRPFSEIDSFEQIAIDFNENLGREDNLDIENEFNGITARYGSGVKLAVENFEIAKARFTVGEYEQFIVSAGGRAVGLCLITNRLESPPDIDQSWPNISGMIMNPFRGQGLGRFSIEERMKVVERDFGNHAWTYVKYENDPSNHLVASVGFERTDQAVEGWDGHYLYVYDGNR